MQNLDLSQIKKVFFIGIGGIGISALAKMCKARGLETSGLNDEEGKTVDSLKEEGIEVILLRDYKELPEADLYVYSDAWIYRGPEVIESARNTGKLVLSFFEALGEFAKQYKVIAISGTHGKTTTTAMTAKVLIDAGLDPTVIVGSFVKEFGSNFRKGNSEYLVVEADEYNRHMLNFHPYIGAITNIEIDHLDCYKDLDDIKQAFAQFFSQSEIKIDENQYHRYISEISNLKVPGEHNRKNASLAFCIGKILGIKEQQISKSLSEFTGTWRRLEKIGETREGVVVYDDYAHHPTEVSASLQALRELYGTKTITVVFQPHLYSRTKALFDEFTKCFNLVDRLILLPIYFAREKEDKDISSGMLAEAICQNGVKAIAFTDFELAQAYLEGQIFGKDDIFVTMGAGEAYKIANNRFKFS